jgi:hypothetical protein
LDSPIYFEAALGTCKEYIEPGAAKKTEVSVAISPLKVTESGNTLKISYGCNMYKGCANVRCQHSHAAYEQSMKKKAAG